MNVIPHFRSTKARRFVGGILGAVCALAVQTSAAEAAPEARVESQDVEIDNAGDLWDQEGAEWPRWSAHDESSEVVIDYSAWNRLTEDFADPRSDRGAVDFTRVTGKGMGYLREMLRALQQVPVSALTRNEQLAFWLNLHNAEAVWRTALSLPLEDDAVRAIIMGARWREQTLEVEGVKLSLVDIARRIVMRQWKDPRVLYGLYLPAHGAPGLPRRPFTGATVWKMLDARAQEFVNSERALEIHGEQLHVSALYFWDKWLFADEKAVLDHLRDFATPALRSQLTKFNTVTATYLNWRVNSYNSGYDPNQDRRAGS